MKDAGYRPSSRTLCSGGCAGAVAPSSLDGADDQHLALWLRPPPPSRIVLTAAGNLGLVDLNQTGPSAADAALPHASERRDLGRGMPSE